MIIFIPNSRITQIFVNSIIAPLILAAAVIYVIYQAVLIEEPIYDIFNLYLSLDNLYTIFSSESLLLVFWIHFLAINLFLGSWVSRDGVRYNISKKVIFIPFPFINSNKTSDRSKVHIDKLEKLFFKICKET